MTQTIDRVRQIYDEIDAALKNSPALAGKCSACGKCCDFESFGHRLYITPPELDYLAHYIGKDNIKPMNTGVCPYNENGKCSVYDFRFASCRIFCCTGDEDFQSQLTESTLNKIKRLCEDFSILYRYMELPSALSSAYRATSDEKRATN
jgi:Fe-S-cluster containining protein